jgi:hypothetical protein
VPPRTASSAGHREEGTASVELIGAIPFLLLAVLVAAQVGVVGQALWSAGIAARAGARAAVVGGDVKPAARRVLPSALRPTATASKTGQVVVGVAVPRLLPFVPPIRVGAESGLGDG